ncbi:CHASE2 domain-containing protein [candidate division WOR-3 bacterium]|nr:CHASE2 domain-containing protein [candidate division WOR-3 bacterium]
MKIKLRSLIYVGVIAFGLAFIALIIDRIAGNPMEVLDGPLHNALERGGLKKNEDIILVDLDEESAIYLGDNADWPSTWLPQILSQLHQAKAVVITLPIFEGVSSPLPLGLQRTWIIENSDSLKRWFRIPVEWTDGIINTFYSYADTAWDMQLAEAVHSAGNVFMSIKLLDSLYFEHPLYHYLTIRRKAALLRQETRIVLKSDFLAPPPTTMLLTKGIGYVDVYYNRNGQVRQVPLIAIVNDKFYGALAFRVYKELMGDVGIDATPGNIVKIGKRKFYLDKGYGYPIHFVSDLDDFKRMSVKEMLAVKPTQANPGDTVTDTLARALTDTLADTLTDTAAKTPVTALPDTLANVFKDKVVFIGSSFEPYAMTISTPVNGRMPQMVLQANLLINLLENKMARPPSLVVSFFITLIFAALASYAVMVPLRKYTLPALAVLLGILFVVVASTSVASGVRISFFTPLTAVVISIVTGYFLYEGTEGKRRKFLQQMVHYYIPADQENEYFERFMELPYLKVDRSAAFMAVYLIFKKEEKSLLEAHKSFEEYRTNMLDIVRRHGGIRLSFIGNSCLFMFTGQGAGTKACHASLEVRRFFTNFDAKYKTEGIGEFKLGVGLALGETLISTLGDIPLLDFAVFGSAVVWARQLALLNFEQKTKILITEGIVPYLPEEAKVIELGELEIVEEKQSIYEYRH